MMSHRQLNKGLIVSREHIIEFVRREGSISAFFTFAILAEDFSISEARVIPL